MSPHFTVGRTAQGRRVIFGDANEFSLEAQVPGKAVNLKRSTRVDVVGNRRGLIKVLWSHNTNLCANAFRFVLIEEFAFFMILWSIGYCW